MQYLLLYHGNNTRTRLNFTCILHCLSSACVFSPFQLWTTQQGMLQAAAY